MFGLVPWSKSEREMERKPKLFYSPFREMEDMMERFLSDYYGGETRTPTTYTPGFNMYRDDDNLVIEASIPGFDKKDISVEVEDDLLTVRGSKKEETEEKEKDYYYREFYSGSFQRNIRLPNRANPEELKAKYTDGILEVRIPITEKEKKSSTINIE